MFRFLVALVFALVALAEGAEVHKVFRIVPQSEEQLNILRAIDEKNEGLNYWISPSNVSIPADLMVPPQQLKGFIDTMTLHNIKYESFIDNVEALLESQTATYALAGGFDWESYHNLEDINAYLDSMAKAFPDKVKIIVGGQSFEGREIKGVQLSYGANKPGIFIESGIHAREWIAPASATYLIDQLLNSKDPAIRELAEAHDWYIFPVVNPDGYVFTHKNPQNPSYRLWRKSRSINKGQRAECNGSDLNRNWAYKWMLNGASDSPCSEDYAGAAAFSEIETRTLSKYISSISKKLFAYISFHSYSQLLMFSYGHTKEHLDNYDEQYAIATKAAEALSQRYGTEYKVGNIAETINYYASGGSIDWVKATLKLPLSYVYELRDTGEYGFLLPPNQIIPTGEELMDSLVAMFQEAKKFGYPSK